MTLLPDATPLGTKPRTIVSPPTSRPRLNWQLTLPSVKATSTSLSQTATQKATNLAVASGLIKADVPPEPKSEDVGKGDLETLAGGDPEALASGDITAARQAVEDIKPGSSV